MIDNFNDQEITTKSSDCLLTTSMSGIQEERVEEKQELREKHERILKQFFEARVTPDFAQNSEDTEALEGWFKLFSA